MSGQGLICQVAANEDGVCWSFTDASASGEATAGSALTAFRRAASMGVVPAAIDGFGSRITPENFSKIAAQQIAHSFIRASPCWPAAGTVTFLDRRTLRTSRHAVTAHPYDGPARQRTGGEFRRDLMALGEGPPLGQEELTRRWQRLSDRRFGAFAGLDDASFRQLPLKVAVARMSDPCGLLPAPAAVIGVGAARPGARQRAMLLALAAYGSIVVDPRLLVDRDGTFLGPRDGDPAPLLAAVRDRSVDAFVRAIDLTGGQERLIPARRAFPVLRQPGSSGPPCGASAALDWRRALAHGLLQHCARLAVAGGPRPGSVLVAEDFEQDGGVRFAAAMVKAAGVGLTLREITGPAGIAVVAGTLTAGETVYGAGATVTDAVREALTGALFRYQRRRDPALRAVRRAAAPAVWTSPAGSGSLDPDRLARGLADLGYAPSVFALDHDRAVHEAFPYILRVVLTRPPGQI